MNIIYTLTALVVGALLTYLIMRLKQEKQSSKLLRSQERLTTELQNEQEENSRLTEELLSAKKEMDALEEENMQLSNAKTRIHAILEANQDQSQELKSEIEELQRRYEGLQKSLTEASARYAQLKAEYTALQEKFDERKKESEEMQRIMLSQFRNMASDIMDEKSRAFKEMSCENLKTILEPLNRDIEGFKKQVIQCYDIENKERASLQEQIKQLAIQNEAMQRETIKLSTTLRGSTKIQGDWGEMILLNILRQSGLREGEDFEIQKTVDTQGDNRRPDAILHFPNHSDLIIDSKVSFKAYDNYMNAESDVARQHFARQHLESISNHIDALAHRDYSSHNIQSLEFVIMFIPIESMFLLALDEARSQGKNLWNDAYDKRIIIMTPTNLVMTVRMLQDMWRQQRLETNIRAIKERAEKIYIKFASFVSDIDEVQQHLNQAVASCQKASNRLTTGKDNLFLQFEKMRNLGLEPNLSKRNMRTIKRLRQNSGITDETADETKNLQPENDNDNE